MTPLLILAYWAYQFAFYFLMGSLAMLCLSGITERRRQKNILSDLTTILLGITLTSASLQMLSLFFPLNLKLHLIILSCLILLAIAIKPLRTDIITRLREKLRVRRKDAILTILILILVLGYATRNMGPFDLGLYHAQTVDLAREYAAIPGIGNLHDRLAFNNAWLLNVAFFSIGPLAAQPFLYQNSFFLILLYLYLTHRVLSTLGDTGSQSLMGLSYFGISAFFFFKAPLFIASVSPDTPAYILAFVLISELIFRRFLLDPASYAKLFFIFCSSVTIKFSSVFLGVLFLPFLFVSLKKSYRLPSIFGMTLIISILVFLPFFVRNYVLSGYLVYPVYFLDFFNPDWKVHRGVAIAQMTAIKEWARYWAIGVPESLSGSVKAWMPHWYSIYSGDPVIQYLKFASMIIPLMFAGIFKKWLPTKYGIWAAIVGIISLIWFFSAPDPRFAYGTLAALSSLFVSAALFPFLKFYRRNNPLPGEKLILRVLVFLLLLPIISNAEHIARTLINPQEAFQHYPQSDISFYKATRGGVFGTPKKNAERCWNWSPVCTPYIRANLEFRGTDLQHGLRLVPP